MYGFNHIVVFYDVAMLANNIREIIWNAHYQNRNLTCFYKAILIDYVKNALISFLKITTLQISGNAESYKNNH